MNLLVGVSQLKYSKILVSDWLENLRSIIRPILGGPLPLSCTNGTKSPSRVSERGQFAFQQVDHQREQSMDITHDPRPPRISRATPRSLSLTTQFLDVCYFEIDSHHDDNLSVLGRRRRITLVTFCQMLVLKARVIRPERIHTTPLHFRITNPEERLLQISGRFAIHPRLIAIFKIRGCQRCIPKRLERRQDLLQSPSVPIASSLGKQFLRILVHYYLLHLPTGSESASS